MTEQMHQACAQLRFAEGLRRRSEEARAEAAAHEGAALSSLLGVRISTERIRQLSMSSEPPTDPGEQAAMGVWRAAWSLQDSLPPLNSRAGKMAVSPWPLVLAQWHRDICSFLVAGGNLPSDEVGRPQSLDALHALTIPGTAISKAAQAWRAFTQNPPFTYGSIVLGALVAKRILCLEGVEPTGVCVLGTLVAREPGRIQAVDDWEDFLSQCVIEGCNRGLLIARSVQAGKTLE